MKTKTKNTNSPFNRLLDILDKHIVKVEELERQILELKKQIQNNKPF